MFTIGTAAYKLYSASSQVGSTLSTLSNYHRYVTEAIFNSPSEVENLHPLVKQNLDRLARRIQVLSSPLNYCLLWSQHRGSAVAETIHQSKEVLKQTYHWLHKCNKDKSKLSDKEYMLRKLDEHIHEIDFCLQSLNLALSIIQTTDSIMPSNKDIDAISPSSLLSASNRIMAMHNSGGDVAICFGQLFRKSILQNTRWQRIYRRSALKIYRNHVRRFYELRIECNEYGYDSDDNMDCFGNCNDIMNESHPLTLKFDLTQSIYFTTLSSLIIDLPNNRFHSSFTKANININNLSKHDLIEDAFGWVRMLANQVQEQYIFVLKSGLDDWDKPLSSTDDDDIDDEDTVPQTHTPESSKQTTKFRDREEQEAEEDNEDEDIVHSLHVAPDHYRRVHQDGTDELDHHLTASIASLDTAVQQTRHRTHLGSLLAPGGDYDESHVTPQLMAYMTRLAIYENDYTKPHTVHHTNSTFKKYKMTHEEEKEERSTTNAGKNESVMLNTSLMKQESNVSASSSTSSTSSASASASASSSLTRSQPSAHDSEYDRISNDEIKIKQKQKIPAHLNASDEELYLFLRNPPTPPIPFYPHNIHFTNEDTKRRVYRNAARPYKQRMNIRKSGNKMNKSPNRCDSKRQTYFAAPNKKNEVTITYPVVNNGNHHKERRKRKKNEIVRVVNAEEEDENDGNLSLSISDENHMKYMKNVENEGKKTHLTPKTKTSMAAIKDATNSSLLEHVELMTSQTVSTLNSPRNEPNNDEEILHGNFANLSIDNADDLY